MPALDWREWLRDHRRFVSGSLFFFIVNQEQPIDTNKRLGLHKNLWKGKQSTPNGQSPNIVQMKNRYVGFKTCGARFTSPSESPYAHPLYPLSSVPPTPKGLSLRQPKIPLCLHLCICQTDDAEDCILWKAFHTETFVLAIVCLRPEFFC